MGLTLRVLVLIGLLAVAIAWRPPVSRGLTIHYLESSGSCGSAGRTRLHVLADGTVDLNGAALTLAELPDALTSLYFTSAERVLFVSADPAATMQTVTTVIDVAAPQAQVIGIVTPSLAAATCLILHRPEPAVTPVPASLRERILR